MNRRLWNKVLASTGFEQDAEQSGRREAHRLDAAHRMALEGLAAAFEEAERGRDWFGMKAQLSRIEDAVQSVWYSSRVRDDGSG